MNFEKNIVMIPHKKSRRRTKNCVGEDMGKTARNFIVFIKEKFQKLIVNKYAKFFDACRIQFFLSVLGLMAVRFFEIRIFKTFPE